MKPDGFAADFYSHWMLPWRWRDHNWIDFTIFTLRFEWSRYTAGWLEIEICVLGLGVVVEWYDEKGREEFIAPLMEKVEAYREAHPEPTEDGR